MAAFRTVLAALAFSHAFVSGLDVSPVQKVIQLLQDLDATSKQEKNAEAVEFSKFNQFCTDTQANKAKQIQEADELIESLTAEIEKLESDIRELADKIDELHQTITKSDSDLAEAKAQRQKDNAMYTEQIQDFSESVDALERAINVLSKRTRDSKQAEDALLQLTTATNLPERVQRTVAAFLEMNTGDDFLTRDAPEANAYEFQSGNILDLLKKLRDEFRGKKSDAQKEEMNSKHASDMVSQDLFDTIENAKSDINDKTADKEEKAGVLASDKQQLAVAMTDRADDAKYLAELKVECSEKSASFKEKQELRAEEIKAIGKAIEIMSSPEVSGAADEHLPTLLQKGPALAQLRSQREAPVDVRKQLSHFLAGEGHRLHSQRLAMLADKLSMSKDPFTKVKKMIDELITRLLNEENQETEQKGFCDKELGTNKITRTKLGDTIDSLTSKIDENTATVTEIGERTTSLAQEVSELQAAMTQATELRASEKTKNEATIADAVAAQKAVSAAVKVLKDFYAKAATATGFVQVPWGSDKASETVKMDGEEWDSLANPNFKGEVDKGHKAGMQTFGDTYQGNTEGAGGVLAMLEVIASDFGTLEADTRGAEVVAANAYKDFTTTSEKSVAVKDKETEMLTTDKAAKQSELVSDTKDLKATQDRLLAADRYYDKLKPECVDTGLSHEKRAAARQEEIESLQNALTILSGEDIGGEVA